MRQILLFLKQPDAGELKESKPVLLFKAILFMVLVNLAFAIVMLIAKTLGFSALIDIYKNQQWPTGFDKTTLLIYIVLVGPIVEEFAFRGWFTSNRNLSLISLMALSYYFWTILGIHTLTGYKTIVYTALVLLSGAIIYRFLPSVISFIKLHSRSLAIVSISAFASIHLFNFNLRSAVPQPTLIVAIMIILIPYFLKGLALMWARVRLGLVWSIVLHVMNNALVLVHLLRE
jgi:membrane protease YdiL (CAAX protease family)